MTCCCDATADDDDAIDELCSYGHGISCHLAHLSKGFACCLCITVTLPVCNVADVFRLKRAVQHAGSFGIYASHGSDRHAFLHYGTTDILVWEAEGLYTRVVSSVQLPVDNDTDAKARAEGVTYQVLVSLAAAMLFKPPVYIRQCSTEGFAVGKKVAVIVYEYRYAKFIL